MSNITNFGLLLILCNCTHKPFLHSTVIRIQHQKEDRQGNIT